MGDRTPYIVFILQETERMNGVLQIMGKSLEELQLGLDGALNMTDAMEELMVDLQFNKVNMAWMKTASEVGPTGVYNRMVLNEWFDHKLRCIDQYEEWQSKLALPPSVWISGVFNRQGFITASCQVTARNKNLP